MTLSNLMSSVVPFLQYQRQQLTDVSRVIKNRNPRENPDWNILMPCTLLNNHVVLYVEIVM